MHETEPNSEFEGVPAITATVADDGNLRKDWLETAAYIADVESRLCARWQWQAAEGHGGLPEDDSSWPGFILVGRRAYIDFVATVASGIIEHGPAFAAWAQLVTDPAELRNFAETYLGPWESVEQFARTVLEELGPQFLEEPDDGGQLHLVSEPGELADLLQQRGDISAVAIPEGGVFIFRGVRHEVGEQSASADGGRHV